MKAITLHSTAGGGSLQQQYDQSNNESRDRRSSTTNNPEYLNSHSNQNPGTGVQGGISGIGNIDATVNHYELPNLAQRNNF